MGQNFVSKRGFLCPKSAAPWLIEDFDVFQNSKQTGVILNTEDGPRTSCLHFHYMFRYEETYGSLTAVVKNSYFGHLDAQSLYKLTTRNSTQT